MNVYWLEQEVADVPPDDEWLSATEATRLGGLRFAKRRSDWRLGRWTAKCAVSLCLGPPFVDLANVEIRPAPSGAPEVFIANERLQHFISLSHRESRAVCAVTLCGAALGCDLELIEPRTNAFIADYFTEAEQVLLRAEPQRRFELAALLWSAKESALKALKLGLRVDTRTVTVTPCLAGEPDVWSPLRAEINNAVTLWGWWRRSGSFVDTVVAAPQPASPILLTLPASSPRKVREVTAAKPAAAYREPQHMQFA
jgi:4'-phosphopantetheinyl transferase